MQLEYGVSLHGQLGLEAFDFPENGSVGKRAATPLMIAANRTAAVASAREYMLDPVSLHRRAWCESRCACDVRRDRAFRKEQIRPWMNSNWEGQRAPGQLEEASMKRILIASAAVAALALGASIPSFAQGVGVQVGPGGADIRFAFAPEQRTQIKEYITRQRVAPITVRERIRVGATVPAGVELRAVPSDWGPSVTKYSYVYSGDRVYFVEPSTRKVVFEVD